MYQKRKKILQLLQYLDKENIDPQLLFQQIPPSTPEVDSYAISYDDSTHKDDVGESNYTTLRKQSNETWKQQSFSMDPMINPHAASDQSIQNQPKTDQIFKMSSRSVLQERLSILKERKISRQPNTSILNNKFIKDVFMKSKVSYLVNNFANKLLRGNINSTPVEFDIDKEENNQSLPNSHAIQLPPCIQNICTPLSMILIIVLTGMYSLTLVYPQSHDSINLQHVQITALVFYLIQFIINLTTVKVASGKKIIILKDIWGYYLRNDFAIDFVNILILLIDTSVEIDFMKPICLWIVFKFPQCLDKMEKLQSNLIKNIHYEQYWSLTKVFMFNFAFSHILAIILSAMASINVNNNWMTVKGLYDAPWVQKYIWSYYWGTTIMLTVGFGDLCATNYKQALCLIFIETFSCIVLAYNVSFVGSLIQNIRAEDLDKSKKVKLFKKLADTNNVSEDLTFKIKNYIQESCNLKKKFNHQEENSFVQNLPKSLKKQFLKDSNKKIFQNLKFFKSLLDRSLCNFAQKIQIYISHPQQIVRYTDDDFNILILKKGQLGLCCKLEGSTLDGKVIDRVKATNAPKILSLNFLTRKRQKFQIKSLQYSILYTVSYEKFISILRESQADFQIYCTQRDRMDNYLDQHEVHKCQYCRTMHYKFDCPRLHYIPLHLKFILNELSQQKNQKITKRTQFYRGGTKSSSPTLIMYKLAMNQNVSGDSFLKKRQKYRQMQKFMSQAPSMSTPFQYEYSCASSQEKRLSNLIRRELFNLERGETYNDEVWNVNLDEMASYVTYFPSYNAHNMALRFSPENRQRMRSVKAIVKRFEFQENLQHVLSYFTMKEGPNVIAQSPFQEKGIQNQIPQIPQNVIGESEE